MFIGIVILILLLPVTVLSLTIETSFSSNELQEMGVYLENPAMTLSDDHICPSHHVAPKMQAACGNA